MATTDRLREHLNRHGESIVVVGRGSEAAMTSGKRLRHRRQAGYGIGMVMAIALIGVAGFTFRAADPAETNLADSVADVVQEGAIAAGGEVSEVNVDWHLADTTLSNLYSAGWPGTILVSDGTFYALSTAPGKADPAPTVYASDDGVSWSLSSVRDGIWISDLDANAGSLYAIGTAPGANDDWTGQLEVFAGVSTDEGESWSTASLPVTATAPEGYGNLLFRSVGTRVAAGPGGVVGVVQTRYGLDYSQFVPEEYRGDDFGAGRTGGGIAVVDWTEHAEFAEACEQAMVDSEPEGDRPAECESLSGAVPDPATVFTATWGELGVEAPNDRYSELFLSDNGIDFEAVPSPFAGTEIIDLVATSDGFIGVEYAGETGAGRYLFWSSTDGRAWQQMAAPGDLASLAQIGAVDGELVLFGHTGDAHELTMFTSADGGATWQSADLLSVLGLGTGLDEKYVWASAADIGPDGVMLSLFSDPAGTARLYVSADLTDWSELSLEGIHSAGDGTYIHSVARDGDVVVITGSTVADGPPQWFTATGTIR